jgi:chromate transporter
VLYFARLGLTGFGGPVALANYIRRDLVDHHQWIAADEYDEGLAIATACPGPLAYQLGVYCGYVLHGTLGALSVALAFATAPFLIVVGVAVLYVRYGSTWQLRGIFYGVGPVVIALIARSCWDLARKDLAKGLACPRLRGDRVRDYYHPTARTDPVVPDCRCVGDLRVLPPHRAHATPSICAERRR